MPSAIWTGAISFGLVQVPVKLVGATKSKDVSFNQLEKGTGARIRYRKVSDKTGDEVGNDNIERGEVGQPDQRRQVPDDAAALAAVGLERLGALHPFRMVRRAPFLEKALAGQAVRRAYERRRPSREVGEHRRRDAPVVVDDVGLAEAGLRVEELVEIRKCELATIDRDVHPRPARGRGFGAPLGHK